MRWGRINFSLPWENGDIPVFQGSRNNTLKGLGWARSTFDMFFYYFSIVRPHLLVSDFKRNGFYRGALFALLLMIRLQLHA